jgi:hypothetical protein
MGKYEHARAYCRHCDKEVTAKKDKINHLTHLILVFLSCGLWFPFWILSSMKLRYWFCSQCFESISRRNIVKNKTGFRLY